MKKLSFLFGILLLGLFSVSLMGQNKCTVGNTTVYSSDNILCFPSGENTMMSITLPKEKTPVDFGDRELYNLSIIPSFNCFAIGIWSENGFSYFESVSSANVQVPEGHYSIAVGGDVEGTIILTYEIDIQEDTTLQPETSEVTTTLHLDSYDENGNDLKDNPLIYNYTRFITFYWRDTYSLGEKWTNLSDQAYPEITFRYNTIPEGCFIIPTAYYFTTEGQKCYFINYDTIVEGSHGYSTNHSEDLLSTREYFGFSNADTTSFFNMNYRNDGGDKGFHMSFHGYHPLARFDQSMPLTIVTNVKDEHPGEFGPNEWKYRIFPIVYESTVNYSNDGFYDDMTHSAMYINADNKFVREPFDDILNQVWNALYHQSYPNYYPMTPALLVQDPGEDHYYGFRTPMWYFQGIGFSSNGPMGFPFYGGILTSFGEEGVQRPTDDDLTVEVKLDGETLYNDYIYAFNNEWNFVSPAEGIITMEIENNHVENHGLVMGNRTHIEFDLSKDDAYPPTLTILQVMNEDGKERIDLQDLGNSKINIAAGDFFVDMNIEEQQIISMAYYDRPDIWVWYSVDGGEYQPLEVFEDESMFHENYGNFYVVDLGQLEGVVNNQWVSLKVTVTDAQGNFQTQELDNLFYAGQFTSINEDMMTSKNHTVHPNPFTNEVRITAANTVNGTANIQVYNLLGEQVYQQTQCCNETKEFTIDGSALKSGIYFYSISTENGLMSGRILKE